MLSGPDLELCQSSHESGDDGCWAEERGEDNFNESLGHESAYL